ncbi:MAG: AI-2E family transporter [Cyanophyceae cyanobacterium]
MKLGQWLGLICFVVSLYILWQIRQLLLLVFAAVVLATALNRVVCRFQRARIQHGFAVFFTISLFLLVLTLVCLLIVPPFINQFRDLIELVPLVWEEARLGIIELEQRLPSWLPTPPSLSELITQLQPVGTELIANFLAFFQNSLAVMLKLLLAIVLTLMFLGNPRSYRRGLLKLFPSFYRQRADEILTESEVALANWLGGILINCLFIATLSGIGLAVLQVPLVLAHALLAGLLNFIPNVGPALSVVFPVMVALLDAPWKIIAIVIWYVIIQQIETYWLTPMVMAKQVSLLPAVTLTAQIFFATVFGLLGLLLALPLTVVAKTWLDEMLFADILDKWDKANHPTLRLTASVTEEAAAHSTEDVAQWKVGGEVKRKENG